PYIHPSIYPHTRHVTLQYSTTAPTSTAVPDVVPLAPGGNQKFKTPPVFLSDLPAFPCSVLISPDAFFLVRSMAQPVINLTLTLRSEEQTSELQLIVVLVTIL